MSAREDWQAYCQRNSQFGPHSDALRLAQALIDEQAAEIERLSGQGQLDGLPLVPDDELRVDLFRPPHSNMGGMTTGEPATTVRLTHVPTGLTAECSSERSQLQNKAAAMRQLREALGALRCGEAPPVGLASGDRELFGPYVTREEAMRLAVEADERSGRALAALEDGIYDGAHHKDWVIDQAVRRLLGCPEVAATGRAPSGEEYSYTKLGTNEAYQAWLGDHEGWSEGVAP